MTPCGRTFFNDEAGDAELVALLRRVGLPSAAATDAQIHELLGERALELSGGQQQRLALARLLMDDAPIVILDEPLAGVDAFTFRDLADDLRKFLGESGKTVILISHRLAFAAYADHVVVLGDHGCVLEEGSREELVARGNVFHDLYLSALMEHIPDANESDLRRHMPRSVSLR